MTDQLSIFDSASPLPAVGEGPEERAGLDVIHGDSLMPDEERICRLLEKHIGKDAAVKASVMEELFGMSNVEVRKVVRHLIDFHGMCIGSSGAGYFIARTPDEIATVTRSLRHRGISILVRAAKIQRSAVEEVFNQARLELETNDK